MQIYFFPNNSIGSVEDNRLKIFTTDNFQTQVCLSFKFGAVELTPFDLLAFSCLVLFL